LEKEGDTFEYVERRKVETTAGIVKKNEPVCETLSLVNYPESLSKKVTLLKHFRNYLIEQEKKSDDDGSVLDSVNNVASTAPMTYVKKWVRTKHAILFRLSNQTVQIVFYDQTEVLLTPDQRFVTYVDKRRNRSTYYLNDELVGTNPEMAKRLKYAKEILSQLMHGQPTR
jgi:polo-like kinase 1